MWLPNDAKYSAKFRYFEVAHYVPKLEKVIRQQNKKVPVLYEWGKQFDKYREAHHNRGIYTSVFQYDAKNVDRATRLGSLYFDVDSDDGGVAARRDAIRLVEYLQDYMPPTAIRIYFTGKKGFHIECEAIALGIRPSNDLPGLFRFIATALKDKLELESLDFAVYDPRRMWRVPNSQHQSTGLFKVELTFEQLTGPFEALQDDAKEPHWDRTVPAQKFNGDAEAWYREWQYQRTEKASMSLDERIERFKKFGSALIIKETGESELVFDPKQLFEHCPAMMRLWEQAEQEHDLPHEARLFLCSILSYTEDAEWYLHQVLKNCNDYDPPKTQSHIDDWKRRRELGIGGRPYTCERANSVGVGCGDCDLKPKEKLDRIGGKLVRTGEMSQPSPFRFAYMRRKI